MDTLKEQQTQELTRVENGHRDTLEMLGKEKESITGSLQEALNKESTKMDQLHQTDLANKEKVHEENLPLFSPAFDI